MNKLFTMMVALVATLFATSAFAYNPPPSPAPASWISDPSHVLSDDAHARLDAKLKQINQSSANEVAALILPTLDGENIADVGDLTSKAWGVGKKNLDNGVLVVLAMKEHKSRISTGKGVEGDLPDLKCNDILQSARPFLRSGNVEGALGFIFDNASSSIANHRAEVAAQAARGTSVPAPNTTTSTSQSPSCQVSAPGSDSGGVFGWVIALLALGLGGWYLANRSARRRAQEEETERQGREERARLRRLNIEREANRRAEEQRLNAPVVPVVQAPPPPPAPRPVVHTPAPVVHHTHTSSPVSTGVSVAAGIALAAQEEENRRHRAEEDRRRRERDEEESRRARERAEEDRRRRDREDEDRRRRDSESSSSSSSSFDWGGSSGGSGGFGGGDSGGGGSSSDW